MLPYIAYMDPIYPDHPGIFIGEFSMVFDSPNAPWCWTIDQHLPEQHHPNVGKYTIHRA